MKRARLVLGLGLALLAAASPAVAADQSGLPPDAARVLGRFVGDWDTTIRIARRGPPDVTVERRGRATGRPVLGGRYVEVWSESVPSGQSELQLMTFDVDTRRYRQWVFDSGGYRHEAVGSWDPETSTLTWTGEHDGLAFVIADRWVTPDRLEWSLTRTGADGGVRQTIRGTLVRIKAR